MKELYRFRQFLAEGVIKENEEQGYTLYDTKVEYDNGKTGYMFQLVNSEDREENEIGFDQLFFDDEDNRLEMGVDFNSFDQGSYQEGEYTADEAMELYRKISEGVIKEEDIAEMAYERDSVEDIVKRIKPILANHPQLKKQEDPEQYLIDFVTKRKRFINKNEAPIGKDKFARNIGTMPYDKYIKLQFNEYIYSTTP